MAELEELLARIEPNEFQGICVPLFRQLAKCASSQHYRVAERALNLWSNEKVLELVKPNSRLLMPIMFQALYTASDGHWNATIAALVGPGDAHRGLNWFFPKTFCWPYVPKWTISDLTPLKIPNSIF